MRVHLKVVGGKNDGREIRIKVPEFVIGRGDDAHLKPTSDLVSRRHCSVKLEEGEVVIRDLKSRNGTFVNGVQLESPHKAKSGDKLRVGRLQFEVVIDPMESGNKKPKVAGVVDAAARSVGKSANGSLEDSITDWLNEEVEDTPSGLLQTRNNETVHMNLDQTAAIDMDGDDSTETEQKAEEQTTIDTSASDQQTIEQESDSKKKKPGKLPPVPKFSHDDSKTAADDVLRRFFNRS